MNFAQKNYARWTDVLTVRLKSKQKFGKKIQRLEYEQFNNREQRYKNVNFIDHDLNGHFWMYLKFLSFNIAVMRDIKKTRLKILMMRLSIWSSGLSDFANLYSFKRWISRFEAHLCVPQVKKNDGICLNAVGCPRRQLIAKRAYRVSVA